MKKEGAKLELSFFRNSFGVTRCVCQGVDLRIIGGDLKRKKLLSVRGAKIRPTADRLRESIFNILGPRVRDAIVLDLFAGTGAFGIEALSRGAESAAFIEVDKKALSLIERNIRSCNLDDRGKVIKWDIGKNLNCIKSARPAFDLVFMDPPYSGELVRPALLNLHRSRAMDRDAIVVVEHSTLEPIPEDILGLKIVDQRSYGKTLVSFLNYMV